MTYDPEKHHRRSIRLKGYDYSQSGAYFITICTQDRGCLFGEVADGEMRLNDAGAVVADEWIKSGELRDEITLDKWVVMPNHFHAVVIIHVGAHGVVGAHGNVGAHRRAPLRASLRRPPKSLGSLVAGFKSAVTKRINALRQNPGAPVWQRNYYEHIIRDEESLNRIREYIVHNPLQWALDRENPHFVAVAQEQPQQKDEPWRI